MSTIRVAKMTKYENSLHCKKIDFHTQSSVFLLCSIWQLNYWPDLINYISRIKYFSVHKFQDYQNKAFSNLISSFCVL
jgi:hypothetical protein